MSAPPTPDQRVPQRLLTFRGGGWVILLAAALVVTIIVWRTVIIINTPYAVTVGDGRNVETYGFDLSNCLVPREQIVAAGFPKNGMHTLNDPKVLTPDEALLLNQEMREQHLGKFMVDRQRVVGVSIAGETRAYAIKYLTWHEIVNDTLGGIPIAVTYNPLCDSTVVFDRRLAGEVLDFGVSGLLYNSNLLMYDRRPDPASESLWSPVSYTHLTLPTN